MGPLNPQATGGAGDAAERLRALRVRARSQFAEQLGTIDLAIGRIVDGSLDEAGRREAERAAHRLAGTAGTVGFPAATEPARRLEAAFARSPLPAEAEELASLVAELRGVLLQVEASDVPAPRRAIGLHVAPDLHQGIQVAASAQGIDTFTDSNRPETTAAIIDVTVADSGQLIRRYAEGRPPVPVLVLADPASLTERLTAANSGGSLVLPRDTAPSDLVKTAASLAHERQPRRFTILAVDDDPIILDALPAVLDGEPLELVTLADPGQFWKVLEGARPDLVMLDLDMPHIDGIQLCRVLRTDPTWSTIPVLFLTAHRDPTRVDAIFAAGADDYVNKPLVASELRSRIRNRLDRYQLQRRLADTDPLTGLANRRRFESEFERLRPRASEIGRPLSVAILDVDHFKHINDAYGHAAGDFVLHRVGVHLTAEFRGEDVIARWGGDEIAILAFGMTANDTHRRLTTVLRSVGSTPMIVPGIEEMVHVTLSAGISELSPHHDELRALIRAADGALYDAKVTGRGRALTSDGRA